MCDIFTWVKVAKPKIPKIKRNNHEDKKNSSDESDDENQLRSETTKKDYKIIKKCTGFYTKHATERLLLFRVGVIGMVDNE